MIFLYKMWKTRISKIQSNLKILCSIARKRFWDYSTQPEKCRKTLHNRGGILRNLHGSSHNFPPNRTGVFLFLCFTRKPLSHMVGHEQFWVQRSKLSLFSFRVILHLYVYPILTCSTISELSIYFDANIEHLDFSEKREKGTIWLMKT